MVQSEQIICKVAFWYFRRMALMFLLLTGGGAWFYYDGLINWPNKNKIYLAKIAFEAGSEKRQWDDFTREIDKYDTMLSIEDIELIKNVFQEGKLPEDPTIYLVAPTRTDPSKAPKGHDNLKILPHIPPIDPENPHTMEDYMRLKERVIDKLERMGLENLRKHTVVEDLLTPVDIEALYNSNQGSIYGVVSDWKLNRGFKAPKQSSKYRNLFFTGGSVNPGGGMPMAILCGQKVSDRVVSSEEKYRS